MTFSIEQEKLSKALNILYRFIPNKPQLPSLSAVHISLKEDVITLTATDVFSACSITLSTTSVRDTTDTTSYLVAGRILKESVQSLSSGVMECQLSDKTLTMITHSSRIQLPLLAMQDFPIPPSVSGHTITLTTDVLQQVQQYCQFAVSTDVTRPVLGSFLCSLTKEVGVIVATDGFRLCVLSLPSVTTSQDISFLFPARVLTEILKITDAYDQHEVTLHLSSDLQEFQLTCGDTTLYSKIVAGEYPPYEKIIPHSTQSTLTMDVQTALEQVKRAMVFSKDNSNIITLECSKKISSITAESSVHGSFRGEMEHAVMEGDDVTLAFNARYLFEYLHTLPEGEVSMQITDALKPVLCTHSQIAGYSYVIMPFKVHT
ncbi:MAG: DNA polymerase III subunit beta [Pseudomonadales bacterium]|nr:DNA polymerase III subunit beta [Pseudomonadales bacterium]